MGTYRYSWEEHRFHNPWNDLGAINKHLGKGLGKGPFNGPFGLSRYRGTRDVPRCHEVLSVIPLRGGTGVVIRTHTKARLAFMFRPLGSSSDDLGSRPGA